LIPEELTRFLRHVPLLLYAILVAVSAMLFGKMLLLGYLLANGIYPYDFLDHDLALLGIYVVFGYFFAGLTLVLYGWAIALYSTRRGKPFPIPLAPLLGVGALAHLAVIVVAATTFISVDMRGSPALMQLHEVFLAASGGSKTGLLLLVGGNLLLLLFLAILCGALYVGGFKGIMTGRILPFVALFFLAGATPHGSAVIASLVLRTWGIGGGLEVKIERKNNETLEGRLILLTPHTVYLSRPGQTKRVVLLPRSEAGSIEVEQHTWTE
jgi:hypothetical protein